MTPAEAEAVKEILLDLLHTTDNDEHQAALWMVLVSHDELEVKIAALRGGMIVLLEGTA